ncbi:MAG: sulfite exporter TauE/SafE family protein [Lentisphaerae bacterium]|nr:sulfite exporter TauE/SafE family protein [Lentisphaerota bacterium]
MPVTDCSATTAAWIVLSVFLMGMSKGGFPAGAIALPLLVLIWPSETDAARSAVAFVLPLLCVMDAVAMCFYWRRVQWYRLVPLIPGAIAGIAIASVLFLGDGAAAIIPVPDRALKFLIGLIGLLFVAYQAGRKWLFRKIDQTTVPGPGRGIAYGMAAGITSTLAHAGGPVLQMYLLPQRLPKLGFAATTAAFFFMLNLAKLLPFAMMGRFQQADLLLGAKLVPVIPLGVGAGYLLVRLMRPQHYVAFIYIVLAATSVTLILRAMSVL